MQASNHFDSFIINLLKKIYVKIKTNGSYLAIGEIDGLLDAPDVLLVRLPLPGVHGNTALGNGSGSVILGAEDVARGPLHFSPELSLQVEKKRVSFD